MSAVVIGGDVDTLWKIEKIRSETMKEHSLGSGLSCAKTVPDSRRQKFIDELQKLVEEWPLEVIKRQKDEKRKELAATLQHDLPTMLSALSNMGLKLNVLFDIDWSDPAERDGSPEAVRRFCSLKCQLSLSLHSSVSILLLGKHEYPCNKIEATSFCGTMFLFDRVVD
ncbi:hypothetical protein T459_20034 [Capsicum annuum]|uniref:Uncharacterized protein n=1 Tax=Capsicum annuum TaxID=4072 RepID=A0A2G2Z3B3_CAPAN|nr:hypothetical protein T459_20034 [Capsicum annuum]